MKKLNVNYITQSCINIPHIYCVTWQHLSFTSKKKEHTPQLPYEQSQKVICHPNPKTTLAPTLLAALTSPKTNPSDYPLITILVSKKCVTLSLSNRAHQNIKMLDHFT
jgi:hypothetical protein